MSLDPEALPNCIPPPSTAASVGSVLSLGIARSKVFPSMLNFDTSNASVDPVTVKLPPTSKFPLTLPSPVTSKAAVGL